MCRVESAACAEGLAGVDACSLPLSEPAIFVAGLPTERTLLLRPAVFLFPIGVATAFVGAGVAVESARSCFGNSAVLALGAAAVGTGTAGSRFGAGAAKEGGPTGSFLRILNISIEAGRRNMAEAIPRTPMAITAIAAYCQSGQP